MSNVDNFTKCIEYIESTGKQLYHPDFKVIPDDYDVIYKLLVYIFKDSPKLQS